MSPHHNEVVLLYTYKGSIVVESESTELVDDVTEHPATLTEHQLHIFFGRYPYASRDQYGSEVDVWVEINYTTYVDAFIAKAGYTDMYTIKVVANEAA